MSDKGTKDLDMKDINVPEENDKNKNDKNKKDKKNKGKRNRDKNVQDKDNIDMVLCQEKVQVKHELFTSIIRFMPHLFPCVLILSSISFHTH